MIIFLKMEIIQFMKRTRTNWFRIIEKIWLVSCLLLLLRLFHLLSPFLIIIMIIISNMERIAVFKIITKRFLL